MPLPPFDAPLLCCCWGGEDLVVLLLVVLAGPATEERVSVVVAVIAEPRGLVLLPLLTVGRPAMITGRAAPFSEPPRGEEEADEGEVPNGREPSR
jgi:hypothetical protein